MISSASTAGTAKHARFGSRSRPASGNSRLATPTNRPNAASNPAIEAQIHLKPPTIAATFRARLKQKSQSPLVLRGIPYNPYTRKGALLDLPAETGNHHHLHLDMQQPLLHCPAVEKRGCTHALPAIQAAMTSPSTLRRTWVATRDAAALGMDAEAVGSDPSVAIPRRFRKKRDGSSEPAPMARHLPAASSPAGFCI